MRLGPILGGMVMTTMLAGCAGDQLSASGQQQVIAAPVVMEGRWVLAAPNAPTCGMNFAGVLGAHNGAIEPEGGCPGDFFTSRHWHLAGDTLSISDHDDQPLAQLKFAAGRFEGQSTGGMPVTLTH